MEKVMQILKRLIIKWNRPCNHGLVMKIPSSEILTNKKKMLEAPAVKVTKTDTCQIEVSKAVTDALKTTKTMKPKISIVHAQGQSSI